MQFSASDELTLSDLRQSLGDGFSISPPPPYDRVLMSWANGRRCTDTPDPGPDTSPGFLWADGTPVLRYPHPPSDVEWRALVAEHGFPLTRDGKTVGNWPAEAN